MCAFFFSPTFANKSPLLRLHPISRHSTMASSPPPSPGLSKKTHFQFPEQPSRIHQITSKSHSNSILKTLTVLVLLLVIPSFPSQAPDFISQTIFTQFWEVIHLLFIGIAVSYGLFGRKTENHEISRSDDSDAYLSDVSHLSSIFEYGFDDQAQDGMQSYYANCQCFGDQFLGKNRCLVHGGSSSSSTKITSFRERENFIDNNGKTVNHSWSSNCLQSESSVVVSNGGNFDFKPLNLPIRSLRSNVVDSDKPESQNRLECDRRTNLEAKGRNDVRKVKKIRGVVPTNLENKFGDPDGSYPITWHSESGRMENQEKLSRSIRDIEFERIMSRANDSSEFSNSPELKIPKVGNSEDEEVILVSRPKMAPLNDEVSFSSSSARSSNVGDNIEEDSVGKGKQPIAKAFSKAKSVRTKKPSPYITTQNERYSSRIDGKLEDFKANSFVKRGKEEEPERKPPVNDENYEVNRRIPMPTRKPSRPDFLKEGTKGIVEENVIEFEEECGDDRGGGFNEHRDEDDAKTDIDYDLGSEVDRKAAEFIAKFREQIRLQKDSSTETYSREFV